MIDNITLVAVHVALAVLIWRLIRTPDPDNTPPPRSRPTDRFRRSPGADD